MKTWLAVLAVVIAIGCIYLFSNTGNSNVSITKVVEANPMATFRTLQDTGAWKKWWPQPSAGNLEFKGSKFVKNRTGFNSFEFTIGHGQAKFNSVLRIVPVNAGSTRLEWIAQAAEATGIIQKWKTGRASQNVEQNLRELTDSLESFLQKPESLYGMRIEQEKVRDTVLIYTKRVYDHYPSTGEIYAPINELAKYAREQGATITNPPMLFIQPQGNTYEVMTALPVNRRLPEINNIQLKLMVAGKILVGETRGGQAAVQQGFRQMEYYLTDHHKTPPAIPFFSLVTDRLQEPDTAKWITRIYYPIL